MFAVYEGNPVNVTTDGEYRAGNKLQDTDDSNPIDPVRNVQDDCCRLDAILRLTAKLNKLNGKVKKLNKNESRERHP